MGTKPTDVVLLTHVKRYHSHACVNNHVALVEGGTVSAMVSRQSVSRLSMVICQLENTKQLPELPVHGAQVAANSLQLKFALN